MKITFLDAKTFGDDISLELFNEFGEVIVHETSSYEDTVNNINNANVVITNKVVIDKFIMDNTNIKLICVGATGMNNIDLGYAKQKGIIVKNVVGYSTASVAQLTLSMALQFIQKVSYFDNFAKNDSWAKSDIFTHLGKKFYELENKTWGIIGLGNIGLKVASIANAFDCNIQYYSTSGMNKNTDYTSVTLEELLKTSDIISIHCALSDTTLNMINSTNLPLIREKTILLNLGRGGIVNEEDISKEIDKRELYYGTDVVTKEPIEVNSPLLKVVNKDALIITPHIAWASIEARKRLLNEVKNNINMFLI